MLTPAEQLTRNPPRRVVALSAEPGAGTEWSFTVPGGRRWEVVAVYAALVTDATVADRAARLIVGDGSATILSVAPAGLQAASSTVRYAWLPGGAAYQTGNGQVAPLPALVLDAGQTVGSSTEGIVGGDDWGVARMLVIESTPG